MSEFYTARTATAVIIANMIGMGVFTSLGFQLVHIQDGFPILLLWILGGIASLCGAASYAELGAALPRSGGEYNFLGRIYHPFAGFISGWVSATVGFAAPIAAVAIAFGKYTAQVVPGNHPEWVKPLAVMLVLIVAAVHSRNRQSSGRFQILFTGVKVVLILLFCGFALALAPDPQTVRVLPVRPDLTTLSSPVFAVSLIYVVYAYTGWNAAVYISGELENPQKDLPKILITGTALVMGIYLLLNYVFLRVAPVSDMAGQVEIGYIAASHAFGDIGGRLVGAMMALLLISSVSAMTLAGPRALQAIGEDFKVLGFLGKTNADGVPFVAIASQSLIAIAFILTSSFETILIFAGSMIALNSFLAILGVFVLRWREPNLERPYTAWAFPLTPLIYMTITGFMLVFVVRDNPVQALFGLAVIGLGVIFYLIANKLSA